MGPQGLRETAHLCLQKSHYAAGELTSAGRLSRAFDQPTFKEFVLRDTTGRVEELLARAAAAGYFAGVPLSRWYPALADCFLVAVTEKRTKAEIDGLATALESGAQVGRWEKVAAR
jgi:glycine dehydrogenase subunit 1